MSQVFKPSANLLARVGIGGSVFSAFAALIGGWLLQRGPYYTREGQTIEQPVPFSHQHHVGGLGISCVYCHNSVEKTRYAGMPPTQVCMSCHSQIWTEAEALKPVRESWTRGTPIAWNGIYNLPDYVYFNHSVHVAKGVGCSTCHGQMAEMPLTYKAASLTMGWCLNCHRNPSEYQRPREKIYDATYHPPGGKEGVELSKAYGTYYRVSQLQNCSICHR